jgi:DNA-binding Xre family transcriptional regulator
VIYLIRCNLAVLLAEQNLKITKVSKDTGISRTTLTALSNNYSQGIQFDTLNTLCMYLKVSPEQMISHVPVDIEVELVSVHDAHPDNKKPHDWLLEVDFTITKNFKDIKCSFCGVAFPQFNLSGELSSIKINVSLWDAAGNEEIEKENFIITNTFRQLPRAFLTDIQESITEGVISHFNLVSDSYDLAFHWERPLL